MTRIEKNNFKPLVDAAENSQGFDRDHSIAQVKVGYDEELVMQKVDKIIEKSKQRHKTPYCSGAFEPCCHAFSVL